MSSDEEDLLAGLTDSEDESDDGFGDLEVDLPMDTKPTTTHKAAHAPHTNATKPTTTPASQPATTTTAAKPPTSTAAATTKPTTTAPSTAPATAPKKPVATAAPVATAKPPPKKSAPVSDDDLGSDDEGSLDSLDLSSDSSLDISEDDKTPRKKAPPPPAKKEPVLSPQAAFAKKLAEEAAAKQKAIATQQATAAAAAASAPLTAPTPAAVTSAPKSAALAPAPAPVPAPSSHHATDDELDLDLDIGEHELDFSLSPIKPGGSNVQSPATTTKANDVLAPSNSSSTNTTNAPATAATSAETKERPVPAAASALSSSQPLESTQPLSSSAPPDSPHHSSTADAEEYEAEAEEYDPSSRDAYNSGSYRPPQPRVNTADTIAAARVRQAKKDVYAERLSSGREPLLFGEHDQAGQVGGRRSKGPRERPAFNTNLSLKTPVSKKLQAELREIKLYNATARSVSPKKKKINRIGSVKKGRTQSEEKANDQQPPTGDDYSDEEEAMARLEGGSKLPKDTATITARHNARVGARLSSSLDESGIAPKEFDENSPWLESMHVAASQAHAKLTGAPLTGKGHPRASITFTQNEPVVHTTDVEELNTQMKQLFELQRTGSTTGAKAANSTASTPLAFGKAYSSQRTPSVGGGSGNLRRSPSATIEETPKSATPFTPATPAPSSAVIAAQKAAEAAQKALAAALASIRPPQPEQQATQPPADQLTELAASGATEQAQDTSTAPTSSSIHATPSNRSSQDQSYESSPNPSQPLLTPDEYYSQQLQQTPAPSGYAPLTGSREASQIYLQHLSTSSAKQDRWNEVTSHPSAWTGFTNVVGAGSDQYRQNIKPGRFSVEAKMTAAKRKQIKKHEAYIAHLKTQHAIAQTPQQAGYQDLRDFSEQHQGQTSLMGLAYAGAPSVQHHVQLLDGYPLTAQYVSNQHHSHDGGQIQEHDPRNDPAYPIGVHEHMERMAYARTLGPQPDPLPTYAPQIHPYGKEKMSRNQLKAELMQTLHNGLFGPDESNQTGSDDLFQDPTNQGQSSEPSPYQTSEYQSSPYSSATSIPSSTPPISTQLGPQSILEDAASQHFVGRDLHRASRITKPRIAATSLSQSKQRQDKMLERFFNPEKAKAEAEALRLKWAEEDQQKALAKKKKAKQPNTARSASSGHISPPSDAPVVIGGSHRARSPAPDSLAALAAGEVMESGMESSQGSENAPPATTNADPNDPSQPLLASLADSNADDSLLTSRTNDSSVSSPPQSVPSTARQHTERRSQEERKQAQARLRQPMQRSTAAATEEEKPKKKKPKGPVDPNAPSRLDLLYYKAKLTEQKKVQLRVEKAAAELRECTFQPNFDTVTIKGQVRPKKAKKEAAIEEAPSEGGESSAASSAAASNSGTHITRARLERLYKSYEATQEKLAQAREEQARQAKLKEEQHPFAPKILPHRPVSATVALANSAYVKGFEEKVGLLRKGGEAHARAGSVEAWGLRGSGGSTGMTFSNDYTPASRGQYSDGEQQHYTAGGQRILLANTKVGLDPSVPDPVPQLLIPGVPGSDAPFQLISGVGHPLSPISSPSNNKSMIIEPSQSLSDTMKQLDSTVAAGVGMPEIGVGVMEGSERLGGITSPEVARALANPSGGGIGLGLVLPSGSPGSVHARELTVYDKVSSYSYQYAKQQILLEQTNKSTTATKPRSVQHTPNKRSLTDATPNQSDTASTASTTSTGAIEFNQRAIDSESTTVTTKSSGSTSTPIQPVNADELASTLFPPRPSPSTGTGGGVLLYVDIQLGSSTERITVHRGDLTSDLAAAFTQHHQLDPAYTPVIQQMLDQQIQALPKEGTE